MATIDELPLDQWRSAIEQDMVELILIQGELLETLVPIVKRLESLPDAAAMDSARSAMIHVQARLHDLAVHYLGPHESDGFTDFAHPDYASDER